MQTHAVWPIDFDVDSSIRFLLDGWTDRYTDKLTHATNHPTHATATAGVGNLKRF